MTAIAVCLLWSVAHFERSQLFHHTRLDFYRARLSLNLFQMRIERVNESGFRHK